jgi:hypothetical protein
VAPCDPVPWLFHCTVAPNGTVLGVGLKPVLNTEM